MRIERLAVRMMLMLCLALHGWGCGTPEADDDDAATSPTPAPTATPGPADDDLDGVAADLDCDDADPATYPDADELCDSKDNDCDLEVDEGLAVTVYRDADEDGYGVTEETASNCGEPEGYATTPGDCDDGDPTRYPGNPELCDGIDNDCDGIWDDNLYQATFYVDQDGDTYGDPAATTTACDVPAGYAITGTDCDDLDAAAHPSAPELCDGTDNDCNNFVDEGYPARWFRDEDGDGFGTEADVSCQEAEGYVQVRGDCDDQDAATSPGADDAADDGIDQDCGGSPGTDPHVGLSGGSLTTIQAALDAAAAPGTVWVGPGTYLEHDLTFAGKAVQLRATHPAEQTVIDADSLGRGFIFKSSEGSDSRLDGFTITGGITDTLSTGAGIYLSKASPTIVGCTFSGNRGYYGGGIGLFQSGATITGCTFTGNDGTYGGGIALTESGSATVMHSTFESNTGDYGAGMYVYSSDATIRQCDLETNSAAVSAGGIYIRQANPTISNCILSSNQALGPAGGGGGLFIQEANPILHNCRILDNVATDYVGGGIRMSEASPTLSNCLLKGNTATLGGGMHLSSSSPTIQNCVLTENSADAGYGGGLYLVDDLTRPEIVNTILAYNPQYNLYVKSAVDGSKPSPSVRYCDLYTTGSFNHNLDNVDATVLTVEPGFLSYGSDGKPVDFHLILGSPLIDAGDPATPDPDGSASDLGLYGSTYGDVWDLDADGYPDYFWPGEITDAPAAWDPANYDCEDGDASVPLVTNCHS